MIVKPITNKKISFDFDGTLEDDFDGTINLEKDLVQSCLKQYQELGNDCYIVTKRYSPEYSSLGKINEHIDVFFLASKLGIPGSKVIFTNRKLKAEKLMELGIDIHFENGEYEEKYLNTFPHDIKLIMVTSPDWKKEI